MTQDHLSIKSWSLEDRPREKLYHKGREILSNSELIAILLGSGSRDESAVSLAQRILNSVDNDLNKLGKMEIDELMKFKGIGDAKAMSLTAALELGRRRRSEQIILRPRIESSIEAFEYISSKLEDLDHEEFHIIYLNRRSDIIKTECISRGGVSATLVDPKIVFNKALQILASTMILIHNHPSGGLKPSQQDISLTKKLKKGAELLDMKVIDHLIIGDRQYFSFADEGIL